MDKKHIKRSSTSLIIGEMQLKSTMRYHLTSSKNLQTTNTGEGVEKNGTLLCYSWDFKMVESLWRMVWRFLRKPKIGLPYDLAIPLLGMYPEKTKIGKDPCTPVFTAPLFAIARTWKQPICTSTLERRKRMWYISIYNGILPRHKKNKMMPFAAMWDLEMQY